MCALPCVLEVSASPHGFLTHGLVAFYSASNISLVCLSFLQQVHLREVLDSLVTLVTVVSEVHMVNEGNSQQLRLEHAENSTQRLKHAAMEAALR